MASGSAANSHGRLKVAILISANRSLVGQTDEDDEAGEAEPASFEIALMAWLLMAGTMAHWAGCSCR